METVDRVGDGPTRDGYWPLVCRGDESLDVLLHIWGHSWQAPGLFVTFEKGAGPSGLKGEHLAPGTCSWPDRGMYADEPNRLTANLTEMAPAFSFHVDATGDVINSSVRFGHHPSFTLKVPGIYFVMVWNNPEKQAFDVKWETLARIE